MKKITFAFLCIFMMGATFAQQQRTCSSMSSLEHREFLDPSLRQRMDKIERFTQKRVKEMQQYESKVAGEVITIPVVVHIIYNTIQYKSRKY